MAHSQRADWDRQASFSPFKHAQRRDGFHAVGVAPKTARNGHRLFPKRQRPLKKVALAVEGGLGHDHGRRVAVVPVAPQAGAHLPGLRDVPLRFVDKLHAVLGLSRTGGCVGGKQAATPRQHDERLAGG
jgi:hypothetical protein